MTKFMHLERKQLKKNYYNLVSRGKLSEEKFILVLLQSSSDPCLCPLLEGNSNRTGTDAMVNSRFPPVLNSSIRKLEHKSSIKKIPYGYRSLYLNNSSISEIVSSEDCTKIVTGIIYLNKTFSGRLSFLLKTQAPDRRIVTAHISFTLVPSRNKGTIQIGRSFG